jgi:hypothetical protein
MREGSRDCRVRVSSGYGEEHNTPAGSRSYLLRNVFHSAGGVTISQDAIRLLIGTKALIEYTLANVAEVGFAPVVVRGSEVVLL